jgi:serine/threonine protein kinase, bacterial
LLDSGSVHPTAAEISKLLGINVTDNPAGGGAGLALSSTSYGTFDHSAQVTPRSCVGVVFTGEHDVYGNAGFQKIKTQTFGTLYQGASGNGPYLLQQTAAVLPSAERAQAFLTSLQAQWDACTKGEVSANFGYENARGFTLGGVQRDGDLMAVSMGSPGGLNAPDACQQALGVRVNVVVETRTCEGPTFATNPNYGGDPNWAVPDAERLAKAMLDKVKIQR